MTSSTHGFLILVRNTNGRMVNMRLIRADELIGKFVIKGQKSKRYRLGETWELNLNEIKEVVDSMPTVGEDRIVADGRQESYWEVEHHGGFSPGGNPLYRCHNCKWIFGTHMIYPNFRFCPECGYKMIDNRGNQHGFEERDKSAD